MPKQSFSLLHCLRTMSGAYRQDTRNDAELIERFVATHDETAVATLAVRHGPMVWEICRRICGNDADAEDAYQVTFLALAKKASKIHVTDTVAGWLCQVARQAALDGRKAKRTQQKFQKHLQTKNWEATSIETWSITVDESYAILYEELAKLSEKQRVALVLHFLEGKTHEEVAEILCVGESAVRDRLNRGKAQLLKRLAHRGLALGSAALAAMLEASSRAAMPRGLIAKTVQAATALRDGALAGGLADLAGKILKQTPAVAPWWKKSWMIVWLCVSALGLGGSGVAWKAGLFGGKPDQPLVAQSQRSPQPTLSQSASARSDSYGDPLPEGAIARIGTTRFRTGGNPDDERLNSHRTLDRVTFLPNGKTLVSVHGENCVHFWDAATGKEIQRLAMPASCQSTAVSSDGAKLAVAGCKLAEDALHLRMWDIATNPPRLLWEKTRFGARIAFSPDGKTLAGLGNGSVLLCNAATGTLIKELRMNHPVERMTFTPDGRTLAVNGGPWSSGALWDVATGTKLRDLKEFQDSDGKPMEVYSWSFSPDGKMLAATHGKIQDPVLGVWDLSTGALRHRHAGDERRSFIAFLPNGPTLLESHHDNIRLWNLTAGGKAKLLHKTMCIDPLTVAEEADQTCLSSDGKLLAKAAHGVVRVWDVATGQVVGPAGLNEMGALALTPDGKSLVAYVHERKLQVWETETGRAGQEVNTEPAWLLPQFYHFDGRRIIAAVPRQEAPFATYDIGTKSLSDQKWITAHQPSGELPTCFAVSTNGRWAVWGSSEQLLLLDRSTQKEVSRRRIDVAASRSRLQHMDVSADGRSVLLHRTFSNSPETLLEVWLIKAGKCQLSRKAPDTPLFYEPTVSLSPDGRWIALVAGNWNQSRGGEKWKNESTVRLIEAASDTYGKCFETTTKAVLCSVAWSPDGRFLAGGDANGDIWLWDLTTKFLPRRLQGHLGGVHKMLFSQDGLRVVSASYDATALIWEMRHLSGQEAEADPLPSANDLWERLRSPTADKAWPAMQLLMQNPSVSLPLLRERLRPIVPHPQRIAALLARLDDNDFRIRQRAEQQLGKMGEAIEPALREALAKEHSVEGGRSIGRVLDKVVGSSFERKSGYDLRELRAYRGVEVLERIGTPAARQVLEELSRLPTGLVQADEAEAALQRMRTK